MSGILAPFSKVQQDRLKVIDATCQAQIKQMSASIQADRLLGKEPQLDPEVAGWIEIINCYGLLYNRCIEAGWIDDTYLTNTTERDVK